ncbi:MAG: SAM-dependent methyltransferase, partial [Clostridia bacterium]|nr:SAM-dependent methyltransferase [Clostridia bacterium]
VGTDHGYLPAYLAVSGYTGRIVASDINRGPLDSARQTAKSCGALDKIEFILCDGLDAVSPESIENIIIAGMGGETIASILAAAPWTKESGRLLILQPMSKTEVLRRWLHENGYRVLSEELCMDGSLYRILTASGGQDSSYSPAEFFTGHLPLIRGDALFSLLRKKLIVKTSRTVAGLERSSKPEDTSRLAAEKELLSELKKL